MAYVTGSLQILEALTRTSDADVTTPTDAELTVAFGSPPDGFIGLVDDAGAGTAAFLVLRKNSAWFFQALTKAT